MRIIPKHRRLTVKDKIELTTRLFTSFLFSLLFSPKLKWTALSDY